MSEIAPQTQARFFLFCWPPDVLHCSFSMSLLAPSAAARAAAPDDALTCAAIGSTAYIMAAIAHETIGHPAMALISGGRIRLLTSVYMEATTRSIWIDLAGPAGNLLAAGAGLFLLRRWASAPMQTRFFCWTGVAFNLLWSTGYLIYSGISGRGDFSPAAAGLEPVALWCAGLVVFGGLSYGLSIRLLTREMRAMVGSDATGFAQRRSRRLIWSAWLAAGLTASAAAALDPIGLRAIWEFGALSSFLAGAGMLSVPGNLGQPPDDPIITSTPITRDLRWLGVALVMVTLFIFVLGRGIHLTA